MFCIHVAGDEFDALPHDFRQNSFPSPIYGCNLDQLNDAPSRIARAALFSPHRLEFIRPLADQSTL
jgi:hypothetical protein